MIEEYKQTMIGLWHHFKGREDERDISRIFYITGHLDNDTGKPMGYGFTKEVNGGWVWHELNPESHWGVWGNEMADMNLVEKILIDEALNRGCADSGFRNAYKLYNNETDELIYEDGVWFI